MWEKILESYDRISVCGGPKTGKSTLATTVTDRPVISSDEFRDVPWASVPDAIIMRVAEEPRFVLEGALVARALRRGLQVDAVVFLTRAWVERSPGQMSMGKAVATIFREWRKAHPLVPLFELW